MGELIAEGEKEEKITKQQPVVRFQLPGSKQLIKPAKGRTTRDIVKENKKLQGSYRKRQSPVREVAAFTIQTQQKNTKTSAPQLIRPSSTSSNQAEWNRFRAMYDDGDLPVQLEHDGTRETSKIIRWLEDPKLMPDERFMELLMKFSLGLPLLQYPYKIIAERGIFDLLKSCDNSQLVIQCFPQLVSALHATLCSPETTKKKMALRLICQIAEMPGCGPALIPYYKHLITPLRMLSDDKVHDIEYQYGKPISESVEATLNTLEKTGFPKSFTCIKSIIPTYESCMMLPKP